jgi:hypothetical protein
MPVKNPQVENADSDVNRLAHELELAELGGDPALQPPFTPWQHPLVHAYRAAFDAVQPPFLEIADADLPAALARVKAQMVINKTEWHRHRLRRLAGYRDLRRCVDCVVIGTRLYHQAREILYRMACVNEEQARRRRAALKTGTKHARNITLPNRREKRAYTS